MSLNIQITKSAAQFYRQEMNLPEDKALRLFVRVGGLGCGGYSIGVRPATPSVEDHTVTVDGMTFCVKPDDAWYIEGMSMDYDPDFGIRFDNRRFSDLLNPVEVNPFEKRQKMAVSY